MTMKKILHGKIDNIIETITKLETKLDGSNQNMINMILEM